MFDKLKKAFSSATKGIGQKEITEKLLDDTLLDLQIALLESDVAQEVVDNLSSKLQKELLGLKLEKGQEAGPIIQSKLQNAVAEIFARAGKLDLIEKIRAKKAAKAGPFVIVFLGINGTGKTTTVAKMGNLIRKAGFSVVVAAGDTHRAGAIEQLEQHMNRLSLKIVKQRYGADPSSVGRDAVEHAKKNYLDVVLIDTAGRMQTSKNLMDEMSKIVRVVKPDVKLFIGDALAGNDTINQAREFFQYATFDGAVLTKIDADAKGGAAMSIAYITSKPITFVGVGQGYDDLVQFDPDKFIESLFGSVGEVSVEHLMSMPRPLGPATEETRAEEAPVVEEKLPQTLKTPIVASPTGILAPKAEQKVEPLQKPEPKTALHVQQAVPVVRESEPFKEEKVGYAPYTPKPPPKEIHVLPSEVEQPKEKKGRFGLFGKKKSDEDRRKEEEEKHRREEQRGKEEEEKERTNAEEEERQRIEKEKEEKKKKRKEDKDTEQEENKVIYLTDEDIEDLLK
jgi:fused signal recognition particle receptor